MHPGQSNDNGFVDVHVHMVGAEGIETVLSAGISAVRNAGMRGNAEQAIDPNCRHRDKPVLISSFWALYKRGGYGARFGVSLETRSEIKSEILKLKSVGADIIKVIASGMVSLKKPGTVTPGGFEGNELRYIVEEAERLGLGVMAHANSEPAILAAIDAGVRSIEHGFFMTPHALDLMADKGVFWTPTIGALVRAAEIDGNAGRFIMDLIHAQLQMLQHAYVIGVPLAIGTDCVLPDPDYKAVYESELSYFEQAGIPPQEVMKIACEGGARLLSIIK